MLNICKPPSAQMAEGWRPTYGVLTMSLTSTDQGKTVFSVGDYILKHKDNVKLLQLIKLCYLCYGWYLSFHEAKLFREEVQAWRYGPVIPELYHALKHFRGKVLPKDALSGLVIEDLDSEERDLIDEVLEVYKDFSGLHLSTLTHQKGTPWHKTPQSKYVNPVIKDSLIKEHFDSLREQQN